MDIGTRALVIDWFEKNHNFFQFMKELGEDPSEEVAKMFQITYNQARACEREAFRRSVGISIAL
jgi:hypothetical protein